MMMTRDHGANSGSVLSSPTSPLGITTSTSKSSKSSSFQSIYSDDGSITTAIAHFEDSGLDDDASSPPGKALSPSTNVRQISPRASSQGRSLAVPRPAGPRSQRSFPNLHSSYRSSNPRNTSTAALSDPRPLSSKGTGNRATSLPLAPLSPMTRHSPRSPSPTNSLSPRDPNVPVRPRRGSWQSTQERKSFAQLEHECEEDDGDDIPDGMVLDNVPISPRPPHERPPSRAPSPAPSQTSRSKERVRSVGNGTPAVAQAQGSLKSPTWKAEANAGPKSPTATSPNPGLLRSSSWSLAHAELNIEARMLTEKLEEHADELEEEYSRRPGTARPNTWNASRRSLDRVYDKKERIKSSTPELPPLRRMNVMIDPLPVSKEKEAVLSRTRPSWLPPKDPAEERRHLKEYQKMMAASVKADERRQINRKVKSEHKDIAADGLMAMWEKDIIPRWDEAVRERRTRELWWRGVAPRSRGFVWSRALGNQLGLSPSSYQAALSRARALEDRVKQDRANGAQDVALAQCLKRIRDDVAHKTWPDLRLFAEDGPLHQGLVDVLSAYAMYRSDIGYSPGCNTIAALLLLNLPSAEMAFMALANVLNRPLPLSFHTSDASAQASAYNLVVSDLGQKSPKLQKHLTTAVSDFTPESLLHDFLASMGSDHLAMDEAARLWDVYVFEGDAVLIRAAVAYLLSREMALLGCSTNAEAQTILSTRSFAEAASRTGRADMSAEDHFMQCVREAGKS